MENKHITKSIKKTIHRGVCFGGFIIFENFLCKVT